MRRSHGPLIRLFASLLLFLPALPFPAFGAAPTLGYDPTPDFIAFDPQYRERKRQHRAEYERLKQRLNDAQRAGRSTNCSKQLLDECKWLLHYTADFPRLQRRLADLHAMLDADKDPHEKGQNKEDGSWGCCSSEWFFKLVRTDDEIVVRELTFRGVRRPVTLLDRVNSPEKLREHLDRLLISDVRKTGIDRRYELNLSASILTRFLAWEVPSNYRFHPKLAETLWAFQDETWQDPETGYWGAWYRRVDGSLAKTSDLSITFHLIHYRGGDVERWPQIVKTTLAIRGAEYPYGWLEDGRMSNHHNYDVAAILRFGWKHMTPEQRAEARVQLRRMLDYCLKETLNADGTFKLLADESTYAGAQLFGVSLLDELGYLNKAKRFWTDEQWPEAEATREKIIRALHAHKSDDAEMALAKIIAGMAALAN